MLQEEFTVVGIAERERQPGIAAAVVCQTADGKEFRASPEMSESSKRDLWCNRELVKDGLPVSGFKALAATANPGFQSWWACDL